MIAEPGKGGRMTEQKTSLRKRMRTQLDEFFSDGMRARASAAAVAEIFLSSEIYRDARTLLAYAAVPRELPLDAIIRSATGDGKHVALPRTDATAQDMDFHYIRPDVPFEAQLLPGNHGIREPLPELPTVGTEPFPVRTVVLVPGIAFTPAGDRLGRGKGYYDRYLCRVFRGNGTIHLPSAIVGICLDLQLMDEIPVAEHDIALTHIVTPSGIIKSWPGK